MMGVQCATTGVGAGGGNNKRKLEVTVAAAAPTDSPTPAKNGRWEADDDDCIARLQAVAVPATADAWRAPTLTAAATLLAVDDDFDDDDFDDELSDEEKCAGGGAGAPPEPARFAQQSYNRFQTQTDYWQYYQPPPPQQTIRCEENGKSYLELGPSPPIRTRCCDGRTRWCHVPCFRQRRLAVLNLSMCKLARYRQCSDPSLRRSVLICNTLRRLEREMEAEPQEPCFPNLPPLAPVSVPDAAATTTNTATTTTSSYEQSLRDMNCSGRATPFPSNPPDTDSGLGDDEMTRPINWGSVLSLTSQTDLESLNNNELYAELGLSTSESMEWKQEPVRTDTEWDGFMHVLVGGT